MYYETTKIIILLINLLLIIFYEFKKLNKINLLGIRIGLNPQNPF